jgi:hypothetical protein
VTRVGEKEGRVIQLECLVVAHDMGAVVASEERAELFGRPSVHPGIGVLKELFFCLGMRRVETVLLQESGDNCRYVDIVEVGH